MCCGQKVRLKMQVIETSGMPCVIESKFDISCFELQSLNHEATTRGFANDSPGLYFEFDRLASLKPAQATSSSVGVINPVSFHIIY